MDSTYILYPEFVLERLSVWLYFILTACLYGVNALNYLCAPLRDTLIGHHISGKQSMSQTMKITMLGGQISF